MQFRILGPLEVLDDGRQLHLGRPKQRAVLAILLLHANRVVALDRLVEELWGEQPPPQAIGSLQAYVSHLRRLLEPDRSARTPAGVLLSQPPGYRLVVAPLDLDASRFQALAADGHALLEAGDHRRAAAVLAESLALWRGPVLADFGDTPFAQAERHRLEELRLCWRTGSPSSWPWAATAWQRPSWSSWSPPTPSGSGCTACACWRCTARAARIAHGDLGLASVMLDEDGKAWLVDFDRAEAAAGDRLLDRDVATLLAALDGVADPELVRRASEQALGLDVVGHGPPAAPTSTGRGRDHVATGSQTGPG